MILSLSGFSKQIRFVLNLSLDLTAIDHIINDILSTEFTIMSYGRNSKNKQKQVFTIYSDDLRNQHVQTKIVPLCITQTSCYDKEHAEINKDQEYIQHEYHI